MWTPLPRECGGRGGCWGRERQGGDQIYIQGTRGGSGDLQEPERHTQKHPRPSGGAHHSCTRSLGARRGTGGGEVGADGRVLGQVGRITA